jgi:8-oxo-dGTP pyrophosphatase MutT (NUDIX family)
MFFSFNRASALIRAVLPRGSIAEIADSGAQIVAHYVVPVKPPAVPAPSATLVLLRDRARGGFEILLIQRHAESKFAAGDHVFPGGKVDTSDSPDDAAQWCARLQPKEAGLALGLDPATALAHWVGVIRETFEEVGILLAYDATGEPARLDPPKLEDYRGVCQAEPRAFWGMLRAEGLTLAADRLVYFAHWITPEESPLRFDVRFFAAEMPGGQEASADGREIVDVRWLSPREAIEAAARGEISLRNPTMRNIELFLPATSAADGLRRLHGRTIRTIRPRVVMRDGVRHVLMPDDPGYW